MALEFESLSLKDFLNAFYKEYADFQAENKQEFKDKLESYKQNYEQNKHQNEPAIVANALAPLFESLGFQVKFAHKHKGNSEIDLVLLKDSNVEILIEAKSPIIPQKCLRQTNQIAKPCTSAFCIICESARMA